MGGGWARSRRAAVSLSPVPATRAVVEGGGGREVQLLYVRVWRPGARESAAAGMLS